ncbi:MAG: TolC family protein [Sporocytophaga sp.]|nr:TolC family protein [Sporocytophaga sp.]
MLRIAFEKRPDIAALNYEKDLSKVNEKLQKAYAMPNLEAGGIYNPQNSVSYYGTYLTFPIPFFDRNQGEIQKAKVMKLKSETAFEALKLQVKIELSNSYSTYLQKKDNVIQVQLILNQSKEVLEIVRYAYLKSNTTIIDFLEAQRTYYDAMLIFNQAQYDLKRSQIELLYVASALDKLTL